MTAVGTPLYAAPELMRGEKYDEKVSSRIKLRDIEKVQKDLLGEDAKCGGIDRSSLANVVY
jgi:serine/threonine protein kinase